MARAEMEFSELFTHGVRDLLPVARRKGLVSYFDCVGAPIALDGPDAALRAGLHRIMLGMVDLLDNGFVMFSAESLRPVDGLSRIMVHAAGSGAVSSLALDGVLQRLALTVDADDAAGRRPRAQGRCPATGSLVQFVDAGPNGLVLTLELEVPAEVPDHVRDIEPDAAGAVAWLVSGSHGGLGFAAAAPTSPRLAGEGVHRSGRGLGGVGRDAQGRTAQTAGRCRGQPVGRR